MTETRPESIPFLPYGRQTVTESDVAAVIEALHSDFLTTGPAVGAFEARLAEATGAPHVAACSSGTAALHLAMLALQLGPGNRVVVPAITFLATANAARFVGAEVIFADVDAETGLMEARHLEAMLARAEGDVHAVLPVHLNGQCADLKAIRNLCDGIGAAVVEDACHALGGLHREAPIGNCAHSHMATFSFHPVKTVACGEGGAVATCDPDLHGRVLRLRNHGIVRDPAAFSRTALAFAEDGSPNPWHYEMAEPGFNYRLSDIHAALGASQLSRLSAAVAKRRALVAAYEQGLAPLAPVVRPVSRTPHNIPAWHLMAVLIDFAAVGVDRATVMSGLRARGIGSQVHYIPVPWQPYYWAHATEADYPGARAYFERCLSLPLFPAMDEADVNRVVAALAEVVGR